MRLFILIALATALAPAAPAQEVIYVDGDAAGTGDGTSWADAFTGLEAALAASTIGDEIWVAEGVYHPTPGTDRAAYYALRHGVAIYGGFDGTEISRDQRDPAAHVTVLSGDIGAPEDSLDNSLTILRAHGTGAGTRVDGMTITGAQGTSAIFIEGSLEVIGCRITSSYSSNWGGAMFAITANLTIEDTVFEGNRAAGRGGALFIAVGNVQLSGTTFRQNQSLGTQSASEGGAVYIASAANVTMRDVEFVDNMAETGGGVYSFDDELLVVRARFIRNAGSGMFSDANVRLYNVIFAGNVGAPGNGRGGGLASGELGDTLFVYNSAFVGNRAPYGGGIAVAVGSVVEVVNVTFAANDGLFEGDAVFADADGGGRLHNTIIWQHSVYPAANWEFDHVTDVDPLYTASPAPGPDGTWGTDDDFYGDLRPAAASPVIDAGSTALLPPDDPDLDGDGDMAEPLSLDLGEQARVAGAAVDVGAYERQTPVGTPGAPQGGRPALSIAPNPVAGSAVVTLSVPAAGRAMVALYDALGRRVAVVHEGPLAAGRHAFALPAGVRAPGAYVLRATVGGESVDLRVAIAR